MSECRPQILKHQLGALAEDAAALISRGDTLVYSLHARNPLLADFLQARVQDRLRAEWANVMAEIEARRNVAMQAEDHLKVFVAPVIFRHVFRHDI